MGGGRGRPILTFTSTPAIAGRENTDTSAKSKVPENIFFIFLSPVNRGKQYLKRIIHGCPGNINRSKRTLKKHDVTVAMLNNDHIASGLSMSLHRVM
jgi:hypothetical protein